MTEITKSKPGTSLISAYVGAVAVWGVGRLLLRFSLEQHWLPVWTHAILAVASIVPMVLFAIWLRKLLSEDFDEMMQRVVLEGIALGFAIFITVAALYMNLKAGGIYMPRIDPPDIVIGAATFVALGFAIAWRRYR
jgi:hypothetical protein